MAEEERVEWLPPQAPGAGEPPRWDPTQPPDPPRWEPTQPPEPPQPAPAAPPAPAANEPAPRPPAHYAPPPGQPWPPSYGRPQPNNAALISMIAGIGGLVLFVFPAGFGLVFLFNLPASIAAWVTGVRGRRAVRRGETDERESMATWGMILGVVGTILGVLAIVGWALALALSEEVRDEFRRQIEESSSS